MAYKEPHFDRAGAKALVDALGATNAAMVKKSAGAKKSPAAASSKAGKAKKQK